jgi:D-arabinose 1-dehydrogenase-like Zn-dependent alcohol dehydrogenase
MTLAFPQPCIAAATRRFVEFNAAYEQCKGQFDVIINCVAVRVNFKGVLGMLAPDGVAVQVTWVVLLISDGDLGVFG